MHRLSGRLWRLAVLAVAAAGVVAGAGLAATQIAASSSTSTINACQASNGLLRVVADVSTCKANEVPLTWNVQGPAGPAGATGPAGDRGAPGDTGATGPKGDAGQNGATGPKGDPGQNGSQGDTGATGPKGDPGQNGAPGMTGATGPKGDAGQDGAPGATGPRGDRGQDGASGTVGATGPKGDPGQDGAPGSTGGSGPKGDTGDTGPAGATGPQGPQGTPGSGGSNIPAHVTRSFDTELTDQQSAIATFPSLPTGAWLLTVSGSITTLGAAVDVECTVDDNLVGNNAYSNTDAFPGQLRGLSITRAIATPGGRDVHVLCRAQTVGGTARVQNVVAVATPLPGNVILDY